MYRGCAVAICAVLRRTPLGVAEVRPPGRWRMERESLQQCGELDDSRIGAFELPPSVLRNEITCQDDFLAFPVGVLSRWFRHVVGCPFGDAIDSCGAGLRAYITSPCAQIFARDSARSRIRLMRRFHSVGSVCAALAVTCPGHFLYRRPTSLWK